MKDLPWLKIWPWLNIWTSLMIFLSNIKYCAQAHDLIARLDLDVVFEPYYGFSNWHANGFLMKVNGNLVRHWHTWHESWPPSSKPAQIMLSSSTTCPSYILWQSSKSMSGRRTSWRMFAEGPVTWIFNTWFDNRERAKSHSTTETTCSLTWYFRQQIALHRHAIVIGERELSRSKATWRSVVEKKERNA